MKRKHDGGYALLYVLIVLLVLFAICAAISSIALRNYQGQVQSVREMGQLYQAEGEIEKFVALAEDVSRVAEGNSGGEKSTKEDAERAAEEDCWKKYENALKGYIANGAALTVDPMPEDRQSCTFLLSYRNEDVKIETTIRVAMAYDNKTEERSQTDADGSTVTTWTCTSRIESATPTYLSYSITHLAEEGGGSA